jgi:hypothetical protein
MTAYFEPLDGARYRPTNAVQGAWNSGEQHVAPALGLLTHAIERDRDARRDDTPVLTRLSFDILGTLPMDIVDIDVQMLRPGRTVELVEATLSHNGRPAVILRAWLQSTRDTRNIVGYDLAPMPAVETLPRWDAASVWPGRFVHTVEVRRREISPGRAQFWLRPTVSLLAGQPVAPLARTMSVLDIMNGVTPRRPPGTMAFPNLDTTVHLFQQPRTDWIGYDTTVSFGADGIGLTHATLHDAEGPIGTAQQTLTLRPR